MASSEERAGFKRSLVKHPVKIALIRSECERCGFILIGGVEDGLPQQEIQHAEHCKKRPQSARSDGSSSATGG
jgi:hypothetical protein